MRTSHLASLSLAAVAVGLLTMGACLPDPAPVDAPSQAPAIEAPSQEAPAIDAPVSGPTYTLPPCASEDSDNCYWDASERGNGQGTDFVALNGMVYYPR